MQMQGGVVYVVTNEYGRESVEDMGEISRLLFQL